MDDKLTCPACGAPVPGDSVFCPTCGAAVSSAVPKEGDSPAAEQGTGAPREVPAPPAHAEAGRKPSQNRDVARIAAGVALAVIGIAMAVLVEPSVTDMSFGGDAYTYIYQGIMVIVSQVGLLVRCVGMVIAVTGALLVAQGMSRSSSGF